MTGDLYYHLLMLYEPLSFIFIIEIAEWVDGHGAN